MPMSSSKQKSAQGSGSSLSDKQAVRSMKLAMDGVYAGNAGASFLWNTNDTTQSITVSSGNTYSVTVTDSMGNDPFMMACGFNRLSNIQMWLKMNSDWKIDRRNDRFGSTALHFAVYVRRY